VETRLLRLPCAPQAADLRANLEAADLVLARRLSHGEGWQPTSAHAPHGPPLRVSGASLSLAQSDAPPTPAKGNAMSNQGGECSGAGSSDEGIGGCGGGRVGVNVGAVEAGSDGVSEVVNNAQTAPSNEPIDPREDTSLQLGELLGGRSLQSLQGLLQVKSSSGSLAKSAKRIVAASCAHLLLARESATKRSRSLLRCCALAPSRSLASTGWTVLWPSLFSTTDCRFLTSPTLSREEGLRSLTCSR